MFGAQLNIKAKEYSLLVVQVLHHFIAIFRKLRADQIANNKLILPIKPKRYNSEKNLMPRQEFYNHAH
jgi:hypothetical protein